MKSELQLKTKLGHIGEFRNGANFSQKDFGEGFSIINVKQLFRGRYASFDNLETVIPSSISSPENLFLKDGDILFARSSVKRSGSGQVAMVCNPPKNSIFSGFIIRFRITDKESAYPLFLNYLLRSAKYRELFQRIANGTTIFNLSQDALSDIDVSLPSLCHQKSIAHILGAIDDKIELNKKTNKTLEETAKALFKSWFIDFDPVKAKMEGRSTGLPDEISDLFPDSFEDSEAGQIPKGWEITNLDKTTSKFTTGLNPRKNFILGSGDNFYVTIKSLGDLQVLLDQKCDKVDDEAIKKINSRSDLQSNDILFSGIGTIGKVVYVYDDPKNWNISESVFSLRANNNLISPPFLYQLLKSHKLQSYAFALASGSVQKGIRMGDLKNYEFVKPHFDIQKIFEIISSPMIQKISINLKQNNTLKSIRELLLPKLISGEIRIPDAEKIMEEIDF